MSAIHDSRYDTLDVLARSLINRRNNDPCFSNLAPTEILYVALASNRFDLLMDLHHTIVSALAALYIEDERIVEELMSRWRGVAPWPKQPATRHAYVDR